MRRRRRCASRLRAPLRCGPSHLDGQARCVIVLGGSRRPNIADSFSITTCCALRCLPPSHKLTSGTLVVAELSLKPNAAVVRQIAGHDDTDMKILPTNGASAVDAALALSATVRVRVRVRARVRARARARVRANPTPDPNQGAR